MALPRTPVPVSKGSDHKNRSHPVHLEGIMLLFGWGEVKSLHELAC